MSINFDKKGNNRILFCEKCGMMRIMIYSLCKIQRLNWVFFIFCFYFSNPSGTNVKELVLICELKFE